MRALVQRVSQAAVTVEAAKVAEIGKGMLILLGVGRDDGSNDLRFVAEKCANLRIFEDDNGKMNRSLLDTGGQALVVSQFTLYGDTRKGRRPGFTGAAPPEIAEPTYERFTQALRDLGIHVATGVFGAHMSVEIHNDGPVTLLVESPPLPSTIASE
jgi:D-tyrosyl-tRNA(Tyr) deacylase